MATILIVDDRPINRELLVTLLTYKGHRLLEAGSGAEALRFIRAERPELVVTDVLMPSMDGYELVRQLRADPATAPTRVIFYSAKYEAGELESLARPAGVAAYIAKPALPEEILRTVHEVLAAPPEPPPSGPLPENYQQEHLRLLMDKLARQAIEAENPPANAGGSDTAANAGPGLAEGQLMGGRRGGEPLASQAPVLYVEDEENDAFLLQLAFRNAAVPHPFRVLTDGMQAIEYLEGTGRFANRTENPLPCLVILDLNLPRRSGMEVLQWIREQSRFKTLPVLIYTSSTQEQDQQQASQLGANAYQVKPPRMPEMVTWVQGITKRWLASSTSSANPV